MYTVMTQDDFDENLVIRSISLCNDLTELERIQGRREELMEYHKKCEAKLKEDEVATEEVEEEIEYCKDSMDLVNEKEIQISKNFAINKSA